MGSAMSGSERFVTVPPVSGGGRPDSFVLATPDFGRILSNVFSDCRHEAMDAGKSVLLGRPTPASDNE